MKKSILLLQISLFVSLSLSVNSQTIKKYDDLKWIMQGKVSIGMWIDDFQWNFDSKGINYSQKGINDSEIHFSYLIKNQRIDTISNKTIIENNKNGIVAHTLQNGNIYFLISGNVYHKNKKGGKDLVFDFKDDVLELTGYRELCFRIGQNWYKSDSFNSLKEISYLDNEVSLKFKEGFIERKEMELFPFLNQKDSEKKKTHFKIKANEQIRSSTLSPNSRYLLIVTQEKRNSKPSKVANYVNTNATTFEMNGRPRVGVEENSQNLTYYSIEKDSMIVFDSNKLAGINRISDFKKEYGVDVTKEGKSKKTIINKPIYNLTGNNAIFEVRSFDNKDRWIVLFDSEAKRFIELEHQNNKAWIGGPGISEWNYGGGFMEWVNNNEFVFQSEETGFSHLYLYNIETKKKTVLTKGNYEIHTPELSKDKSMIYYKANILHPGSFAIYRLNIKTLKNEIIASEKGNYNFKLSPDNKFIAFTYSTINKPWELYCQKAEPNQKATQITFSTKPEFEKYFNYTPEVIEMKSEDGAKVYARVFKPEKSNGAGVIFVHGAGYLQNAHYWWSSYYRENLFHEFLRKHGFTIIDIDYRGSAGYGRDFRTDIYRNMGGKDLEDQLLGKETLVSKYGIDPKKVGIYGGSYGGFITMMALFKNPGEFKCGAALRSVTDWAFYNHDYTSNILNTPEEDSLAYLRSSPIYYAQNLKDRLLILHGMVDMNVQFQDVVRLSQRLIDLEKDNWEIAIYPVEDHGFKYPSSWFDEYKRIYRLFEEELLKN